MKCMYCQHEIPDRTVYCPYCRQKQDIAANLSNMNEQDQSIRPISPTEPVQQKTSSWVQNFATSQSARNHLDKPNSKMPDNLTSSFTQVRDTTDSVHQTPPLILSILWRSGVITIELIIVIWLWIDFFNLFLV